MDRKLRYQGRHRALGLCIKCPRPVWDGCVTCKGCTLRRRMREQKPARHEQRKIINARRDRRKDKTLPRRIWGTPV